jgi:hypothetical protein
MKEITPKVCMVVFCYQFHAVVVTSPVSMSIGCCCFWCIYTRGNHKINSKVNSEPQ